MATAQEILAYTETHVTDDVKKAEAFIKLFFSKEQKPTYEDNPEQQLKVITVLAAAQKSIEANKLKEALEAVKASIKPYKLLELYEIDSLKQHIHDEGIEVQSLFSDEELIAAVKAIEGIEVQALFSDEELAAAGYKPASSTDKQMIPFKYITPEGEIKKGKIVSSGHVSENTGNTPEVIAFWKLVKGHKVERPDGRVKEGQPAKPVMKTRGREEFANLTDDQLRKEFGHLVVAKA
ncbi:hypothetical protein ACK30J_04940 [Aeromonas caviae]